MANSIYNGTFVLGNTSATTLSAGPGIKLDTSVPGVIGISNDETVLWSGASTVLNQTFNLSEPFTNFKKIRFKHCFEGSGVFAPTFTDYDSSVLMTQDNGGQGIGLGFNGCKAQNDLAGWNFGLANIVRVSNTELSGRGAGYFALNTKTLVTNNIYYIYGIYGVDRISGGN